MAVDVHTHEDAGEGGELARAVFGNNVETASLAGSLGIGGTADLSLTARSFFPMIHGSHAAMMWLGHTTDAADPDAPRFGIIAHAIAGSYDVDYRYLAS